MLEPGGELDLAEEAVGAEGGCQLGVENFQRDWPVVLHVLDEVDRGHAAAAELALELVAVTQGVPEGGERLGQSELREGIGACRRESQGVRAGRVLP